jgi:hypothetical protein
MGKFPTNNGTQLLDPNSKKISRQMGQVLKPALTYKG